VRRNRAGLTKGKAFAPRPQLLASPFNNQGKEMPRGDFEPGMTQQSFTGSALFEKTFDEGMALVEETARYLDGKGREESRGLPRKAALLYAGESMRVTTRLMQAASWLLVQRAVHDGDMEAGVASQDRYRLGSKEICLGKSAEGIESLPGTLQDLLDRSDNLYRRIARLDDVLFCAGAPVSGARGQLDALAQAFGGK
jgi:regulator of CtrA degradation